MNSNLNHFLEEGCKAILSTSRYVIESYNVHSLNDTHSDFSNCSTSIDSDIEKIIRSTHPHLPAFSANQVERMYNKNREQNLYYWVINPNNNPIGFVNNGGEFTISMLLMCDSSKLLSILSIPAEDRLYIGYPDDDIFVVEKCQDIDPNLSINTLLSLAKPATRLTLSCEIDPHQDRSESSNTHYWLG